MVPFINTLNKIWRAQKRAGRLHRSNNNTKKVKQSKSLSSAKFIARNET